MKAIHDFDKLDNIQKYTLLQNANELIKHLFVAYDSFPFEAYASGTQALKKSMEFIESVIPDSTIVNDQSINGVLEVDG